MCPSAVVRAGFEGKLFSPVCSLVVLEMQLSWSSRCISQTCLGQQHLGLELYGSLVIVQAQHRATAASG